MSISDFAIKRPIVTIVLMVAISVFGIFALLRPVSYTHLTLPTILRV